MPFENQIHLLEVNSIIIQRNERQRSKIDEDDSDQRTLIDSIKRNGLINPIVVRRDGFPDPVLVAGERRLRAFKTLKYTTIPARFLNEIDPVEAQIIELEENIARKDLTWQDTARAVVKLHNLHLELDAEWTQTQTSEAVSLHGSQISRYMKIGKYFDDPRIMDAQSINKAESMIFVMEGRKREAAFNILFEAEDPDDPETIIPFGPSSEGPKTQEETPAGLEEGLPASGTPVPSSIRPVPNGDGTINTRSGNEPAPQPKTPPRAVRDIAQAILHQDFLEWAPAYEGRKFNFLHVDFPYGAEEVGPQMKGNEATIYEDNPRIYANLLNCFCENLDNFFAQSGWIMFWYSERMSRFTRDTFKFKAPSLFVQTHPLIWFHTDNAGISPDYTKYPRHVYDTALIMSRGNFPLVKMKSDVYGCPTDRKLHPSTKPEPMLKYFFEMFMDEHTMMLDPTCGGGSSLRAAESLGCRRVLGMDANWEYVETARHELQDRRNLYSLVSSFVGRE